MLDAARQRVIVILGPTAGGKSDLAMELARRLGGELVSADSMQVYRGMDIGTAKPTPSERAEVPHHAIDLVDAREEGFTVAKWLRIADDAVAGRRPGSTDPSTAGLVVNSSRELWGAWQRADSPERWQQATGEALDAMNRALAAALGSAA